MPEAPDLKSQGAVDKLKGKFHEFTGSMTGDTSEDWRGKAETAMGNAEQKAGELKEKAGELKRQWDNTPS
ncbi:MAG TPA: CsbD family protein [Oscillatoriaceae cyanobacterium]